MTLRNGHGNGRGTPRIETSPFDELPIGVPAFNAHPDSGEATRLRAELAATRAELDTVSPEDQRTRLALLARLGGYQRALNFELARLRADAHGKLAELAKELLPGLVVADDAFRAGLPLALEFITSEMAGLSRDVAGGHLSSGPSSMVVSAALELLASRVLFARGDFKAASALAQASGQSLARAHEYGAKRALARAAAVPPASRWLRPAPKDTKP